MKKLTLFAWAILLAMSLAAAVATAAPPGETSSGRCAVANGPSTLPAEALDLRLLQPGFPVVQATIRAPAYPAFTCAVSCPAETSCAAPCTAGSSCTAQLVGTCCRKPNGVTMWCDDETMAIWVTTCPCEGPSCTGNQVTLGCS
jgi:hypothetical protein